MFDSKWFVKHQKILLWLVNTKLGRRFFCIDGRRSAVGDNKIVFFAPESITWKVGKNRYKTEFRTHEKFRERIYYGLLPLWKVFHAWDMAVANPFMPRLNLGFDSTGDLFPAAGANSPVDGFVRRSGVNETFGTIRGGAGTSAVTDDSVGNTSVYLDATSTSNQFSQLRRGIFCFATGDVIAAGSTINTAVISFDGTDKANGLGSPEFDVVAATPAATNTLASSDYAQLGTTVFGSVSYASFTTSGAYIDITLDSNGEANIATGTSNVTKFGTRLNWDTDNSFGGAWSDSAFSYFTTTFADAPGTSNDPKLVVDFTPAVTFKPNILFF